jgi:two-component system response regulator HydG
MDNSRVFLLDDDSDLAALMCMMLGEAGFECEDFNDLASMLAVMETTVPDVVVTDLRLGGDSAMDVSEEIARRAPGTPVIWITGHDSIESAVLALRNGAFDFLVKPFEEYALISSVRRAAETAKLRREVTALRESMESGIDGSDVFVGQSEKMREVFALVERIAPVDISVLITGESGSGKEVIAREIHRRSGAAGPFVAINCASIPETLLESELFGHKKGAFTGAREDRDGLFVHADGGTLFLDEIGELPIGMQSKLLRALQERKVRPVGGDRDRAFDTRVLSATNRDLEHEIADGGFREDLYYRLNVISIIVPPLRSRRDEILGLAQFFLERSARRLGREVTGFSDEAAALLLAHDWPGNARELSNAVERGVAVARFNEVAPVDLPPRISRSRASTGSLVEEMTRDGLPTLRELEDIYVEKVLRTCEDNKAEAARVLGIDRKTLYRRLSQLSEEN